MIVDVQHSIIRPLPTQVVVAPGVQAFSCLPVKICPCKDFAPLRERDLLALQKMQVELCYSQSDVVSHEITDMGDMGSNILSRALPTASVTGVDVRRLRRRIRPVLIWACKDSQRGKDFYERSLSCAARRNLYAGDHLRPGIVDKIRITSIGRLCVLTS